MLRGFRVYTLAFVTGSGGLASSPAFAWSAWRHAHRAIAQASHCRHSAASSFYPRKAGAVNRDL
jgi:hypothetical protein